MHEDQRRSNTGIGQGPQPTFWVGLTRKVRTQDIDQDDGGAQMALDMIGNAKDPNSTVAALGALRRWGRCVFMGSATVPIPVNYLLMMFHNLEIIGNFMYPQSAYLPLLALVRSGQLDLTPIRPVVFPLSQLDGAMQYAKDAGSLEIVVMSS